MATKVLNEVLYWEKIKEKDTSQKELSKLLGGSDRTFAAYVKKGNYSIENLKKIADYLGVTVNELWIEKESPDEDQGISKMSLLEDYKILSDKYNKLMETNSTDLEERVMLNQALIEGLYAHLNIPIPEIDSGKASTEKG